MTTLVVISHYNAWAPDKLVALLDQVATLPAGAGFEICVVVNQAEPSELVLPERHRSVVVLYRRNTGYNIGAWNHGWRENPGHDCYLFLQEECRIIRPHWLRAHRRLAMRPRVGLVGEAMHWPGLSWKQLDRLYRNAPATVMGDGSVVPGPAALRASLAAAGIPKGWGGAHLQSLVLCARREVLEAIDGFRIGLTYAEAVTAEVFITKQVEALGLQAREVGPGSFRYILHPQWVGQAGVKRALGRWVLRHLPKRIADRIRATHDTPLPPA